MAPRADDRGDVARRWPRWLAVVAAAGAVLALLPPVQARAKAVAVVGEALDLPVPRPLAPSIARERTRIGGVEGDLYAPDRAVPAVLLVPGATPAGLDDQRAVALARAYARAGRSVFVPDLVLYERRFDEADLDALVDALLGLADREGARGRVTAVGISYGGSFLLVAAADPRLDGVLEHIGVFGAYHDLVGVVQAATTGVSLVDGEALPWDPAPAADRILRESALELVPAGQRAALAAALADEREPDGLPREARAVHDLLANTDPSATFPLAQRLHEEARARLARFAPATVAEEVGVPVSILHSVDDPAVPYAEGLRLEAALPDARLYTVALFSHVDFRPDDAGDLRGIVRDLVTTWRYAGRLLAVQERVR